MILSPKNILSLHADSSVQNVALALVQTDGLDIFGSPKTFRRPFPADLQQELWDFTPDKRSNTQKIIALDKQVTEFFIQCLSESQQMWPNQTIDAISISGHFIHLSTQDKMSIELGNLKQIAQYFHKTVMGHFVQSDLNAGGTGSPLLSVFWQSMSKNLPKPLGVIGLGGVIKLTYIGTDGELGACDLGVGFSLLEKWINRHSLESQDNQGLLAAKGKINKRVLNALCHHPYLTLPPPKSIHRNDFDVLLEQVEGLSLADGCATLTEFIVQMIMQSQKLFQPEIENWLLIGAGRKNTTLRLSLEQQLDNVHLADEVLPFCDNLNAIGYAFLGARCLSGLPISLPQTTGSDSESTAGTIVCPD